MAVTTILCQPRAPSALWTVVACFRAQADRAHLAVGSPLQPHLGDE